MNDLILKTEMKKYNMLWTTNFIKYSINDIQCYRWQINYIRLFRYELLRLMWKKFTGKQIRSFERRAKNVNKPSLVNTECWYTAYSHPVTLPTKYKYTAQLLMNENFKILKINSLILENELFIYEIVSTKSL